MVEVEEEEVVEGVAEEAEEVMLTISSCYLF